MLPQDDHKLTLDELNRKYGTDLNNVSASAALTLMVLIWRNVCRGMYKRESDPLLGLHRTKMEGAREGEGQCVGQQEVILLFFDAKLAVRLFLLSTRFQPSRKILPPSFEASRHPRLSLSSHANVPVVMQEGSRRMVNQCLLTGVPELSVNACMSCTHELIISCWNPSALISHAHVCIISSPHVHLFL